MTRVALLAAIALVACARPTTIIVECPSTPPVEDQEPPRTDLPPFGYYWESLDDCGGVFTTCLQEMGR